MARKSVGSFILTALISTPLCSFAAQYPLTVTDLDGRAITLQHEPQRIILQDGRDIMAMALLDRDNPFKRVVAWNNLARKQDINTWKMLQEKWPQSAQILDMALAIRATLTLRASFPVSRT